MIFEFKKFFSKVGEEFGDIRFAAGNLAFSTLFAMIPFLIVILAFFQAFGGLEHYYPQVESLLEQLRTIEAEIMSVMSET